MGREEHCKQITLVCACSVSPSPAHGVCALPVYTAEALGCSAGDCLRLALGCMHFPDLATQVQVLGYSAKAQTWLDLRFVPFPGLGSSGDQALGERSHCGLSPPLSPLLGFLGVQPAHLLMLAVSLLGS